MKRELTSLLALVCAVALPGATARAEESAIGHYLPGATATLIDMLPAREAFGYVNAFLNYHGTASASEPLEIGGLVAVNLDTTINADTSILLYQTPWKLGGGQYAVGMAIPYIWLEVKGNVIVGPITGSTTDRADGIGDIQLIPIMFGWQQGEFKWELRGSVYAPTGDWEKGRLANLGRHYWTFEPAAAFSYVSQKIGLEATAFIGVDFNTKNDDADYQTGHQFHLETTVAQHLPLFGGLAGLGANAFVYQQVTGDSGSGATLGDFKARTVGVGPVINYVTKIGKSDFFAEFKWLPELGTENRLKSDYFWIKAGVVF